MFYTEGLSKLLTFTPLVASTVAFQPEHLACVKLMQQYEGRVCLAQLNY